MLGYTKYEIKQFLNPIVDNDKYYVKILFNLYYCKLLKIFPVNLCAEGTYIFQSSFF